MYVVEAFFMGINMNVTGEGGKGSARRKGANDEAYAANYDRIFKGKSTKQPKSNKILMPFTGHTADDLITVLKCIAKSGLPAEAFDAFLSEYAKTKDLGKAFCFARCEWDF